MPVGTVHIVGRAVDFRNGRTTSGEDKKYRDSYHDCRGRKRPEHKNLRQSSFLFAFADKLPIL